MNTEAKRLLFKLISYFLLLSFFLCCLLTGCAEKIMFEISAETSPNGSAQSETYAATVKHPEKSSPIIVNLADFSFEDSECELTAYLDKDFTFENAEGEKLISNKYRFEGDMLADIYPNSITGRIEIKPSKSYKIIPGDSNEEFRIGLNKNIGPVHLELSGSGIAEVNWIRGEKLTVVGESMECSVSIWGNWSEKFEIYSKTNRLEIGYGENGWTVYGNSGEKFYLRTYPGGEFKEESMEIPESGFVCIHDRLLANEKFIFYGDNAG